MALKMVPFKILISRPALFLMEFCQINKGRQPLPPRHHLVGTLDLRDLHRTLHNQLPITNKMQHTTQFYSLASTWLSYSDITDGLYCVIPLNRHLYMIPILIGFSAKFSSYNSLDISLKNSTVCSSNNSFCLTSHLQGCDTRCVMF